MKSIVSCWPDIIQSENNRTFYLTWQHMTYTFIFPAYITDTTFIFGAVRMVYILVRAFPPCLKFLMISIFPLFLTFCLLDFGEAKIDDCICFFDCFRFCTNQFKIVFRFPDLCSCSRLFSMLLGSKGAS